MLFRSLKCHEIPGHMESDARQVVFSNVDIRQRAEGSIWSLTPTGSVGSAWAYTFQVRVFSPPPQPGTLVTPLEHVLDDVRTLLSYLLDIELHPDVDGCRALAGERLVRDLSRLVPVRFELGRHMLAADMAEPLAAFDRVISVADDHLLLVLRAARAYERAMLALARGQRDLAYVLFIFVLECLAQARPVPDQLEWEVYPAGQRKALDRAMKECKVPEEGVRRVREILSATKHLRVTENFKEFVVTGLRPEFFEAKERTNLDRPGRRLRRSLMPRLLGQAYAVRSGFAHELAPIAEAVSAEWRDEFCILRNGDPALTFRGLHRIVRGVMAGLLEGRRAPADPVAPPDIPGVVHCRVSYQHWMYQTMPRPDGADAVYWMGALLSLHVVFCAGAKGAETPPHPIPVRAIAAAVAAAKPEKRHRPAMLALAWICGDRPASQPKLTLETVIARVFVEGTCGTDARAAAKLMKNHLRGTGTNALLEFPPLVLIAVWIALASGLQAAGEDEESRWWLELARDDAVADRSLRARIAAALDQGAAIHPHDLLFPRTKPGLLLEGFTATPSEG